jgi:hypothetical protein
MHENVQKHTHNFLMVTVVAEQTPKMN